MSITTGDGFLADDRATPRRKRRGWRRTIMGAARCGSPNLRNLHKGDSMSEFDVMLGMLKKSVLDIKSADRADTEALLAKSFDQFAEAANGFVGAVAEDAFQQGRVVDLLKFDGMGEGSVLAKGMDHVAGFALVMKQLEFFLESWAGEVEEESAEGAAHAQQQAGGTSQEPPPGLVAAAQWYEMGQQVLKFLVAHATGDDSARGDAGGGAEAPTEPGADKGQEPPPAASEQKPAEPPPAADDEKKEAGAAPAESGNQTDEDDEKKRAMSKADATGGSDLLAKFEAMLNERLGKVSAEKDAALAKAADDNTKLLAEIEALKKSTPAPAKGAVMAVGKSADSNTLGKSDGEADLQAEAERLSKMDPEARALALMKIAQRHPQPATLR
ncbi:hypothetical protein ABMY26_06700 (plasmid) [Azospirillum sp. HJ39]|uniref:hypothetical protein n=1 Tax=Azospirillum sp. HJ39 TaxID=3159496 RepID=UPI003555CDB5